MRQILIIILAVVCAGTLLGVLAQRRLLGKLRGEQDRLLAQPAEASENSSPTSPGVPESQTPAHSPSLELLRLRNEVHRLTDRQRELAAVKPENERLRGQVAASRTNGPAAFALAPGYIRKSDTRFSGYSSPEATVQSLLWAVQNRDITNMMMAFTTEMSEQMLRQFGRDGAEEFFKGTAIIPGMHIFNQQQTTNGLIEADVEMIPGQPMPDKMRFRQIDGEWKLESH